MVEREKRETSQAKQQGSSFEFKDGSLRDDLVKKIEADLTRDLKKTAGSFGTLATEINQGLVPTCSVTSISFLLVNRNEAKYRDLVWQIVNGYNSGAEKFSINLGNGNEIKLSRDFIEKVIASQNSEKGTEGFQKRTLSERLIQAAFMKHAADSVGAKFDPTEWVTIINRKGEQISYGGLFANQYEKVYQDVLGEAVKRIDNDKGQMSDAQFAAYFREAETSGGRLTEVEWPNGEQHIIVVLGERNGKVFFYNPHGGKSNTEKGAIQSMDLATFKGSFTSALIHDATGSFRLTGNDGMEEALADVKVGEVLYVQDSESIRESLNKGIKILEVIEVVDEYSPALDAKTQSYQTTDKAAEMQGKNSLFVEVSKRSRVKESK